MLYRSKAGNRTLYRSRPLLLTPQQAYTRPSPGKAWFATTTSVSCRSAGATGDAIFTKAGFP